MNASIVELAHDAHTRYCLKIVGVRALIQSFCALYVSK